MLADRPSGIIALLVILAFIEQIPHATSTAYFDTSFHRTTPRVSTAMRSIKKLPLSEVSGNTAFTD